MLRSILFSCLLIGVVPLLSTAEITLDESPVKSGEWGYRPTDGQTVSTSPPSFVWRPMTRIVR